MEVMSVREHPDWAERAIEYIAGRWASDASRPMYRDCISHALTAEGALPQWYLLVDDEAIAGCAGLIPNDFVSRMDLMPWLCALYVEPSHRGRALGRLLIERAVADAGAAGYKALYLVTDHVGYYEKYGFSHIGTGYHPWGETSRIYRRFT